MLGPRLATVHNIRFYLHLMEAIRQSIREGRFKEWRREFHARHGGSSAGPGGGNPEEAG